MSKATTASNQFSTTISSSSGANIDSIRQATESPLHENEVHVGDMTTEHYKQDIEKVVTNLSPGISISENNDNGDGTSEEEGKIENEEEQKAASDDMRTALATVKAAARFKRALKNKSQNRLQILAVQIDRERQMHLLASIHFKNLFFLLGFLPSVLMTLLAGIFSALDDTSAQDFKHAVTILALVATFWQSLAKQLNHGTRAEIHDATAVALKKLKGQVQVHEAIGEDDTTNDDNFFEKSLEKFEQAIQGNNSTIPIRIQSAFTLVQNDVELKLEPPGHTNSNKRQCLDVVRVYNMAFDELFDAINAYYWWPLWIPPSVQAAERAIKNLETKLKEENKKSSTTQNSHNFTLHKLLIDRVKHTNDIEEAAFTSPGHEIPMACSAGASI